MEVFGALSSVSSPPGSEIGCASPVLVLSSILVVTQKCVKWQVYAVFLLFMPGLPPTHGL